MKRKNKFKIGDAVKCNRVGFSFGSAEGILIEKYFVGWDIRLYKCSNKNAHNNWDQKKGWFYAKDQITKINKKNYYLSKLKE